MTIEAELPDGTILEFPDGTDQSVIQNAVRQQLGIAAQQTAPQPSPQTALQAQTESAATDVLGALGDIGTELAAGGNRAIFGLIDLLGTDTVNAILELSGSTTRIPRTQEVLGAPAGSFAEGLPGQIAGAAGEAAVGALGAQGLVRQGARQLAQTAQGVLPRILRGAAEQGTRTAAGLGGISGAGAEIGQQAGEGLTGSQEGGQIGALTGAVLAPLGAQGLGALVSTGARGVQSLLSSVQGMTDEGAAKLLATAMVREGLGPDDVLNRLNQLGPEAIPADVGNNFARLLRTASNKIPRIEGQAAQVLGARQEGQTARIIDALDDATGTSSLSLDDEIIRLRNATKPQIDALYTQARSKSAQLSQGLRDLLEGENSLGRARRRAERFLTDRRALGEQVTNIDVIDATKQQLDDQINKALRQGENNTARNLVQLKNKMVEEADRAIPEYKQARDAFAGRAQLESAGQVGEQFFKMKPKDIQEAVKTMGDSEKKMFALGAKQAVIDKIDDLQTSADAVKRLFGKRGTASKLRPVFDSDQEFQRFSDALEREAQFTLTRRAAQANSTTAKQLADEQSATEVLSDAASVISDPIQTTRSIGRIVARLRKGATNQENIAALEEAGDLLLASGVNPDRIQRLLQRQVAGELKRVLEKETARARTRGLEVPVVGGVLSQTNNLEQRQ